MTAIEEINERLKKYPHLKVDQKDGSLTIHPPSEEGFKVSICENPGEYTITFGDGWHEHFKDRGEALKCFSFGLSNECRLKVVYRGNQPHKWIVQYLEDDKWIDDSTTGLLMFPFWRSRSEKLFQNNIISK